MQPIHPSPCHAHPVSLPSTSAPPTPPSRCPPAPHGVTLVELEPGQPTMPTAVFYRADDPERRLRPRRHGRLRGRHDGRLMRSMKSMLGSPLEQSTDIGGGRAVKLPRRHRRLPAHLKRWPKPSRPPADRVVLGRPVFFVDDDPARDAQRPGRAGSRGAQRGLRRGAVPVRADRRRAGPRKPRVDASSACWWPTSAAAPRTFRSCAWARRGAAVPTAATTSWPTTACTSPAPTSTATWSWRPSCRCWATARCARPRPARHRARCPAACTSTWPPGT
jgi:hypothetical protein